MFVHTSNKSLYIDYVVTISVCIKKDNDTHSILINENDPPNIGIDVRNIPHSRPTKIPCVGLNLQLLIIF